jgi:hypothetical protein
VKDRHRSSEFIALLRNFDDAYPPEATIRVVMEIKLHCYDLRYFGLVQHSFCKFHRPGLAA